VIQRAKRSPRDDDDRKAQVAGPVAHVVTGRKGDAPAADAFHSQMGKARAHGVNPLVQCLEINRAIFEASGEKRSSGFAKMNRVHFVECEAGIDRVPQANRIFAATGGNRFQGGGVISLETPGAHEPAGKESLADAGVSAGDEEVHGEN